MPSKYRPFYPNIRRPAQDSNDVERGLQAGQSIGKLFGGLAGAIKSARADQAANALMTSQNIADQPGAGQTQDLGTLPADTGNTAPDDNWTLPDTSGPVQGASDDTVGGLIGTGGVEEMKLRQQFQKEQLDNEYKKAQLADELAKTAGTGRYAARAKAVQPGVTVTGGSSSRWLQGDGGGGGGQGGGGGGQGGRGGKPTPYQPGTGDVENDEGTDTFSQISADFDNTYSQKGLYGKYAANLSNLQPDSSGNYPLTDAKGNVIASVPGQDAKVWMQRTNAARLKTGLQPIGPLGEGQNPTSNTPVGTQTNPVIAQSQLHVRSLPFGTVIYDPNTGQTYTKQKPPKQ